MQPVARATSSAPTRLSLSSIPSIEVLIGAAMVLAVIVARPRFSGPAVFIPIADKIAQGLVPYRDFLLEYPPLALFPLALPRLVAGPSDAAYDRLFIILAIAVAVATAAAVAWLAGRGWAALPRREALLAYVAIALAAAPMIVWRFDIFPALFTVLAMVAVASRKPAWAGFALAIGAAIKLYPAFLVPVFVAYYLFGRRWRSAGMVIFGFLAFMAGLATLLFAVAGTDGFTFLAYQQDRGVEIESLMAGVVLAAHNLFGTPIEVFHDFGSYQVSSPLLAALPGPNAVLMLSLGAALAVSLFLRFQRDAQRFGGVQPQTLVTFVLASVLLVMLANKVLSPQYIAWLLPLGALLPWRKSLLVVVICALTTIEFPIAFRQLMDAWPALVFVLNLRNLLLLVLFLWLVLERRDVRETAQQAGGDAERQQADGQPSPPWRNQRHEDGREGHGRDLRQRQPG